MTYQRRLDVNEPDVIDSPYSPPRANVSQGDPAWPLQRSQSTPAAAQIPLQTKPGEKKKNKLGYSRTPVACGPCRHRKIRCVPSQSDPQGSCENCTRLNKECTFLQGDSQQDSDPSSSERASQRAESTVPSNASPPDVRGEPYLRSSQQGYQSPGSLPSSGWPQPSPSLASMSSDRDDMYAVPLPSASSQQVHFTLSHPSAPTYVTSGMPSYMYGGAMQGSGGWQPQQTSSPPHEYDQGSPFDAMYGRATASPYGAAPLRSMSYSGEASGSNNLQQYSPGHHQQLPYQAVHPHGMTSPVPMSSSYASVVPSQVPPPGQTYDMMEGQQQGQYQDANAYPADWTYQQRDQDPEAT